MPVWKYRDVSEMPPPPVVREPEELVRRIRALWNRTLTIARPAIVRGVQKFPRIDAAERQRGP